MNECIICKCKAIDGNAIFRVNEKGVAGIGACQDHIHLFPNKLPDDEVRDIALLICGRQT